MAIPAFAKPAPKVDICHLNGTGEYVVINISENAWETHANHGDEKIGSTVDENCEADSDGDGVVYADDDCPLEGDLNGTGVDEVGCPNPPPPPCDPAFCNP